MYASVSQRHCFSGRQHSIIPQLAEAPSEAQKPGESGFDSNSLVNPFYFHEVVQIPHEEMEAK